MMRFLLLLCLTSCFSFAQSSLGSSDRIDTHGKCSPAIKGSGNKFEFCNGIGEAQGKEIIAKLNQLLNENDMKTVIAKLDELLKRTNPNMPIKTYRCNGAYVITGPKVGTGLSIETNGGTDDPDYVEMMTLADAGKDEELLTKSLALIKEKPDWLTPLLFCAEAYGRTNHRTEARQYYEEYKSKAGPAYDEGVCHTLTTGLEANLSTAK